MIADLQQAYIWQNIIEPTKIIHRAYHPVSGRLGEIYSKSSTKSYFPR